MAATTASIPRFLLPQNGLIWRGISHTGRTSRSNRVAVRFSSSSSTTPPAPPASGPRVLEKPERFNPPSHGARLPRKNATPRHYGGDLSQQEKTEQAVREYPMTPPVNGTWAHRLLYSPWLHVTITVGTLTSLALYTMVTNFKATSPYVDMLPSRSDFLAHPIDATGMLVEVIRLNTLYQSKVTSERRKKHVDDVAKRANYRKAHGLPDEQGFASMLGLGNKKEEGEGAGAAVDGGSGARFTAGEGPAVVSASSLDGSAVPQEPRKKFLGIF